MIIVDSTQVDMIELGNIFINLKGNSLRVFDKKDTLFICHQSRVFIIPFAQVFRLRVLSTLITNVFIHE